MKNIPNVSFSIKMPDGKESTAASLLSICLANPPAGGFDLATMRARNRVADVVEKVVAGGEIALEDADHETAVGVVKAMRWGSAHKDLIKFGELFGA